MKTVYLYLMASVLSLGCFSSQLAEMPDKLPKLIEQEPFPPMSEALSRTRHEFDLKLQIGEDGSVLRAELMSPTGDAEWDSLAIARIEKWRFSPAIYAGKPIRMWISVRACVKCEEPLFMPLAEIVCANSSIADTVYTLLQGGEKFERMVSLYSVGKSRTYNGDLGEVDIHRYAENIQKSLLQLKANECTEPLAMGEQFVIFKRLVWDVRIQ